MKSHQLDVMVTRAKTLLKSANTKIQWSDSVWNVADWLPRRESSSGGVRKLCYTLPNGRRRNARVPLPQPYSDFAKAVVVLVWARSRVGSDQLGTCLLSLRYLFAALHRRGTASPSDLRPDDFIDALADYTRTGGGTSAVHKVGNHLERIAAEADYFEVVGQPLDFKTPKPLSRAQRLRFDPQDLARRIGEDKLPQLEALAAYAKCTNQPLNDDERVLLRATDLHIALGTRIGEALTIPLDCWIEEEVRDVHGKPILQPGSDEPMRRYGIRYFPEKGYDLAIDWLATQDVPLARRAVIELTELCAEARAVARWLDEHPGRLWDYPPEKLLPVSELIGQLHYANGRAFRYAMRGHGVHVAIPRTAGDAPGDTFYRAGDVERVFATSTSRLAAVTGEGGKIRLRLSDALCVKFQGQFGFVHEFRNYRRPLLVTTADIQRALGGGREQSVFVRRGMTIEGPDGQPQRIHMRTHCTRHWKNALYDAGGMTDLQQTWAMHRKDARQTRVYQHRTIQEQTDVMSRFLDFTYAERAAYLRDAIRDGKVAGPLANTYETLKLNSPVEAESFLQTYASGVHITPWGICANDFTLSPCRQYLQCYDQCRHYHRTTHPEEQRRLEDLRAKMQKALDYMRQNAEGEAGGGKWVSMMEMKLANLKRALAMVPHLPHDAPVQVFPLGVDRSRIAAQKSVL